MLALVGMWHAWRDRAGEPAAVVRDASLAGLASWLVFASVGWWWGGWSYGDRYLLDILPIVTLAVAYAIDAGAIATRNRRILAGAALTWSVLLQFTGALYAYTYWNGYNWNATPSIDSTQQRLWDWTDPQWWSVLRQLFTDPGLFVVPALLDLAVAGLILRPLVVRIRTDYSAPAESGGA